MVTNKRSMKQSQAKGKVCAWLDWKEWGVVVLLSPQQVAKPKENIDTGWEV